MSHFYVIFAALLVLRVSAFLICGSRGARGFIKSHHQLQHPSKFGRGRGVHGRSSLFMDSNLGLMTQPKDLNIETMGMPRVIERQDSDGSVRFLMWLQGREEGFNKDGDLPDLSTGRIFFLSSVDGLTNWTLHEDNPVMNPNKEGDGDWWFFDSEHVGLGDIVVPGGNAASKFITQDGMYLMYLYGGNNDTVMVGGSSGGGGDRDAEPTVVKGMRMEIGVAVSQDGVHWSRVEGEHPHGSILEPGLPTEFDGHFVAWPVVMEDGGSYLMYYSTYSPLLKKFAIGQATAPDGIRWTKRGKVFDGGPRGAFDGMGASRCHITKDADNTAAVYKMWYEAISDEGVHSIGLATSSDGAVWERSGDAPVFQKSDDPSAWDVGGVGSPHLIWLEERRRWRLYYVGNAGPANLANSAESGEGGAGEVTPSQIGVAESTDEEGACFERVAVVLGGGGEDVLIGGD